MKKRQLIILGSALLILLTGYGGCSLLAGLKKAPERKTQKIGPRLIKTVSVSHDTIRLKTPFQGKLVASEKIEIYPEVTGRLLASTKPFRIGQPFSKGEVMLAIDGQENLLNLKSQRSNFINAITQIIPDIKIDYPDAYSTWNEYLTSIDPSRSLPELPKTDDDQLKNFLSGRNIYQLFYSIRSLEDRQAKFTITAPFDGTVTMGYLNSGTVLRAGQKAGEFMKDGSFELEGAIATADAGRVGIGNTVNLVNPINKQSVSGVVTRIAGSVDPGSQRVSVYALVNGSALKEGMYLEGFIETEESKDAFEINSNLLMDNDHVFIVVDSALEKRHVEVVDRFQDKAIIKGLSPGTIVMDQVIEGAYEGMLVKSQGE